MVKYYTMADLSTIPLSLLETDYTLYSSKVMELKLADAVANKAQIELLQAEMITLATEIGKRESTKVKAEVAPAPVSKTAELGKDMRMAIDKVPELGPGGDASNFLATLDNIHRNYVDDHPALEERFTKYAVTRLCSSFQTQVHGQATKLQTWPALKKFVSENYGLRLTPYQKLDQLFDLQVDSDWPAYAVKLQNCTNEAATYVEEKWKKANPNEAFTVKVVFDLMATEIFFRRLQESSDKEAYNHICGQLDSVWDLNGAVAKAQDWLSRANRSDSADVTAGASTFFGQSKKANNRNKNSKAEKKPSQQPRSDENSGQKSDNAPTKSNLPSFREHLKVAPKTCYKWVTGRCTKGSECNFNHSWSDKSTSANPDQKAAPNAEAGTYYNNAGFC